MKENMCNHSYILYIFCFLFLFTSCEKREFISCELIESPIEEIPDFSNRIPVIKALHEGLTGKFIPNIDITNMAHLQEKLHDVSEDVTIINFWSVTCKPCIAEMPYLNQLRNRFSNQPVSFLSICVDSETGLKNFLSENDLNWSIYYDDTIKQQLCVNSYPTTIIMNRNHQIVKYTTGGPIEREAIEAHINEFSDLIAASLKNM